MNGVLGQLALAKSQGMPEKQLRLVEQAERSGQQMIGMLLDIRDFSALQENQLAIDRRAFELSDYAKMLDDFYAGNLRQGRQGLRVTCKDIGAIEVIADVQRLRRSTAHLISYVMETAGASDVAVLLDCANGDLITVLSFSYDTGGFAEWRPDMLLGEPQRGREQFASDALGPMVARGILETMGGRIELSALSPEHTAVTITVPVETVRRTAPRVWLDAASATMRMICEAALRNSNIVIASESAAADEVDVALVEAGRED